MARKRSKKHPVIERDPHPFMRVGGPFMDDKPAHEKRYLDLADIALGTKPPEPRRKGKKNPNSPATQL